MSNTDPRKTQLALHLAFKTKEEQPERNVLWFSASNSGDMRQSMGKIGAALNLTRGETQLQGFSDRFWKRLHDRANGEWLIILDGFDALQDDLDDDTADWYLDRAIPALDHVSTVMTLREDSYTENVFSADHTAVVHPLLEEEAILYLKLRLAEQIDINDTVCLARELGGLPLALTQAAECMEESGMALREYLELLQLEKAKVASSNMKLDLPSVIRPERVKFKRFRDAVDLSRRIEESVRTNMDSATARRTDPSSTAEDSGHGPCDTGSITRPPIVKFEWPFHAVYLTRRVAERVRKNMDSATARRTDPSSTAKDSGYGSYESGSIVKEDVEEQEEIPDVQSIRTLSSFVDLGLDGRLRGINIFASDLAQSLSPDIPEVVEGRELVVLAVQDALRAYSYSLEQQSRLGKLSDERKAAHFVRQQSQ